MGIWKGNSMIQAKAYEGRIEKAKITAEVLSSEHGGYSTLMR